MPRRSRADADAALDDALASLTASTAAIERASGLPSTTTNGNGVEDVDFGGGV
jgi:hypothetical protein